MRDGEEVPLSSFDTAADSLDRQIQYICDEIEADEPPMLCLTGQGNFREAIAKRAKYKDRAGDRPFHYYNLKAYIKGKYDYRMQDGLEADDILAIEQTSRNGEACICSIDKDLRAVPGWHYTWEVGNRPASALTLVGKLGHIKLCKDRKKIKGDGLLFFLAQCLTGDPTDTIPGLPRCGPVKAFETLEGCTSYREGLNRVIAAYREKFGARAREELLEQGRLLWMTRKLNEDGSPVLWEIDEDL